MRVSVVIPTYNCGPLAVEAVASVLAQTHPADEIIVVDDGSTDDTAARISAFGPPVRYIRKENGGVSSARNRGINESNGDLIAFLDADDVWHPRKLEAQMAVLIARPELGMLGTGSYDWPAATHPSVEWDAAGSVAVIPLSDLVVRNAFAASSVVVQREVLRATGVFDTAHQGTEDYDLWLRVAQRAPAAHLSSPLMGYRAATPGSLSKNAARMEAGMRMILQSLAAAGVFRGRPLLRHKAQGYMLYSCGLMYRDAGQLSLAVKRILLSLVAWPIPLWTKPRNPPGYRLRSLVVTLQRWFRKRQPRTTQGLKAPP